MPRRASRPRWLASRWLLMICLLFVLVLPVLAQDTGQVCAQSFEDRDADGLRDPDERAIAYGVSASLQNAAGVTIASLLLEDSRFVADGLLCFDQLLAGDYQIILRSAEFSATTSASFSASVNPGAAPALVEFGIRSLQVSESNRGASRIAIDDAALDAVLRGLIGSLIMVLIMSVVGLLICILVFRRRLKRAAAMPYSAPVSAAPAPLVTGIPPPQPGLSMPGPDPLRKHIPGAGSPLLFADEETDAPRGD